MRRSWIQTIGLLTFMLITIALTTGCSKTIAISGEQADDFHDRIEQDYPAIEKTTLTFEPLTFHMTHVLKEPLDEKEKAKLFEDSRRFLMSDRFDEEIIQSPKIAKYFSSGHPNFVVVFRTENPDSISRFELRANNEKNADPVYRQWYYAEDDEALGEPYVEENK
ncbi:hypothetical protein [Saccharibacillus qingshengii]|uniref:hypothetical protein n=1 Tax=Saccharibacillus qingshengii TaxID=1763540 RepID=UPI0015528235|nr:hypothetical protein [Saccharibacillus qingshengii]